VAGVVAGQALEGIAVLLAVDQVRRVSAHQGVVGVAADPNLCQGDRRAQQQRYSGNIEKTIFVIVLILIRSEPRKKAS
jgi:hypothetical protein